MDKVTDGLLKHHILEKNAEKDEMRSVRTDKDLTKYKRDVHTELWIHMSRGNWHEWSK